MVSGSLVLRGEPGQAESVTDHADGVVNEACLVWVGRVARVRASVTVSG